MPFNYNRSLGPQVNSWVDQSARGIPALQNLPVQATAMPVQAGAPANIPNPGVMPPSMPQTGPVQRFPTALPLQAAPIAQTNFAQNRPLWPGARAPISPIGNPNRGFAINPMNRPIRNPNGY